MDRARTVTWSDRAWVRRGMADEVVLPSRGDAISGLVSALDSRGGPVLLTGEPGVGKTWVCRKLRDVMPTSWRWAAVDLSPVIDEAEFLRLILHALGSDQPGGPADLRSALWDTLAEGADDGRQWALIVEEGQNASPGVLEELRILGNRMGEAGAFAGLILVGQNALARRMTTRPLASLQARLSARVHLRPLDVDELRDWVTRLEQGRVWDAETVERLHRETAGNPRQILALAGRKTAAASTPVEPARRAAPATHIGVTAMKPEPPTSARIADCETPPITPGKPPLRVGDGMIEVGWEPTAEPEPQTASGHGLLPPATTRSHAVVTATTGRDPEATVEVIDDHYAALQAWTEWAQNQGREPSAVPPDNDERPEALDAASDESDEDQQDRDENPSARLSGLADVRVEGQHDFAPYSQLFSRLRQPRDSP